MVNLKLALKLVLFISIMGNAYSQHLSTNITQKGIRKLITSAIKSSSSKVSVAAFEIGGGPIYEKIPQVFFKQNEIIKTINEFVPLKQDEDFVFYFNWSPIKVEGNLVEESLVVDVEGTQKNFNANIKLSLDQLSLSGNYIELCELKKWKCDKKNNLYGKIKDYQIKLKRNQRINLSASINISIKHDKVEITFKKLVSNLHTNNNSLFDISFKDFILPPMSLSIDGETINVNLTGLKDALLAEKEVLAKSLAKFAGDFIANDLTNVLNEKLFSNLKKISTTINLLDYDESNRVGDAFDQKLILKLNSFSKKTDFKIDKLKLKKDLYEVKRDNAYVYIDKVKFDYKISEKKTFMDQISLSLKRIVKDADYDLTYESIKSNLAKDMTINFNSNFSLNNRTWKLGKQLRNGQGVLGKPRFDQLANKDFDFAIAISEPMVNGALNIASETGIINSIVSELPGLGGVNIKSVALYFEEGKTSEINTNNLKGIEDFKFHPFMVNKPNTASFYRPFEIYNKKTNHYKKIISQTKDAIVAVAQIELDFSKLAYDGVGGWISNKIGGLLEGGKVWFPLELKFLPQLVIEDGKAYLELVALNPIDGKKFKNTYGFPYKDMKGIVSSGVIDTIKEELLPSLQDIPRIDLSSYLDLSGIRLTPKDIYLKKSGHLFITTDIEELNLKEFQKIGGAK